MKAGPYKSLIHKVGRAAHFGGMCKGARGGGEKTGFGLVKRLLEKATFAGRLNEVFEAAQDCSCRVADFNMPATASLSRKKAADTALICYAYPLAYSEVG